MAIQAVIFDCFGVLCVGSRTYLVSQCPQEGRERLEELFDQADYGYISAEEFLVQSAEVMGLSAGDLQRMLDRQYARDEKMIDFVRSLRAQYKTALLSNANNAIIRKLFSEDELTSVFDEVIVSSEIGMIKPSAELFELAATRLDCLPGECVMVDDVETNIIGAADAGMKGIVFRSLEQGKAELRELGVNA